MKRRQTASAGAMCVAVVSKKLKRSRSILYQWLQELEEEGHQCPRFGSAYAVDAQTFEKLKERANTRAKVVRAKDKPAVSQNPPQENAL